VQLRDGACDITEIPDLEAFFGQQRPPQFTPEQKAHIEAVNAAERAMLAERIELVAFLAPVLCTCRMAYRWRSRVPTQAKCPVHGIMLASPWTGEPILPGMPIPPGLFTPPEAGEKHPHGNDEE
jgi:hypothetical protein